MTAESDGEIDQTAIEKHTREVPDANCHLDLSEHVSWMLGQAVDGVDYPQTVTVTIEVDHVAE